MADQPALDRFHHPTMACGQPEGTFELTSPERQALLDFEVDDVIDMCIQCREAIPWLTVDVLLQVLIALLPRPPAHLFTAFICQAHPAGAIRTPAV
jgi:hypothetical protein